MLNKALYLITTEREVAILNVRPELSLEWATAFENAEHIIVSMLRYLSHELRCCVEEKNW